MISELRVITTSVTDLERSTEFYQGAFDYVVYGTGQAQGPAVEALWQMPDGMKAKCAVLGPSGVNAGLLRLVQFDQPGRKIWGNYERRQDYGHYAMNVRVPEIHEAMEKIRRAGGSTKSEPTYWDVTPEMGAWDTLSFDPDGLMLDVFELKISPTAKLAAYDGRPSELQTTAIHTADARRSARFYAALGYRPLYDKLVENMESFFHLPPGTALHNINMYAESNHFSGRMEIVQYVGFPGLSQRTMARPPNIGVLSASIETDDLDATSKLLRTIGTEAISEIIEVDLPPYGEVRAQSFFGPDDEVLEFYQPKK